MLPVLPAARVALLFFNLLRLAAMAVILVHQPQLDRMAYLLERMQEGKGQGMVLAAAAAAAAIHRYHSMALFLD
jgi:hypothetical protein